MQSLSEKIVSSILCAVFHSPLVNNSEFSNNAGKKAKKYIVYLSLGVGRGFRYAHLEGG